MLVAVSPLRAMVVEQTTVQAERSPARPLKAFSISTASNISLGYMNISNSGTDGINTTAVNGFTLNRSNVTDSAGTASDDGVVLANTTGTVTVDNSFITNSPHNGFTVDNNNTNMAGFNLTNTTISCASGQPCQPSGSTGNDGLLLTMRGSSVLTSGLISALPSAASRALGFRSRQAIPAESEATPGINNRQYYRPEQYVYQ